MSGRPIGYLTKDALDLLVAAGLDGMNVDVKGDGATVRWYCEADVDVVWRTCRLASGADVWIEITTLVIPGLNDGEDALQGIARRIVEELGAGPPWHVTRAFPAYDFDRASTPILALERAREIGLDAGLDHVYVGNVLHHPSDNTLCPECGTILIRRDGSRASSCNVAPGGSCGCCGQAISGVEVGRLAPRF